MNLDDAVLHQIDPGERAVYENAELFRDLHEALEAFTPGGGVSADWIFPNE
ncbi:hypothetical protein LQL77_31025 [Rhodococcus cerastii]|nr:hypothetical protein [Rhodococcus cerastii]MCD2158127.1 hypothetical protein [Rhodococcus cerastii]